MEETLIKFFETQGPWALLFVVTLFFVGRWISNHLAENRKRDDAYRVESKDREEKLIQHNEGYQRALSELSAGQQQLAGAITEMRHDINRIEERINELA